MAKSRMVNTRFWNDGFVGNIPFMAKGLFIYFLTNEHTNICGIYELSLKIISAETDLTQQEILDLLPKINPKIIYEDGWVIIPNFPKYQASNMPKVQLGIQNTLKDIPEKILRVAEGYGYPINTPAMYSNLNSNSNLNLNSNPSERDTKKQPKKSKELAISDEKSPKALAEEFFAIVQNIKNKNTEEAQLPNQMQGFLTESAAHFNVEKQAIWEEVLNFCNYWTEKTHSGRKERWETQKTFEVQRRLGTWFRNSKFVRQKTEQKGRIAKIL